MRPETLVLQKRVIDLRQQGFSMPKIADEVGVSISRISQLLPLELRGRKNVVQTSPEIVEKVKQLKLDGKNNKEIAELIGYSDSQISKILRPKDIHRQQGTQEDKELAAQLYARGLSFEAVGLQMNRSPQTINSWLAATGGIRNKHFKDFYDYSLLEELVLKNLPATQIASQTGFTLSAIYKIIAKKGWTYTPESVEYDTKSLRSMTKILKLVDESVDKIDVYYIAQKTNLSYNSIRNVIQKHRAEQWEAMKIVTHKTCTRCNTRFSLESFPLRKDREGIQAMCRECLKDFRSEASRRRRARVNQARADFHKIDEIVQRDKLICFFCQKQIDPTLRFPDPSSLSIHHIHPISKNGPDILKNVTCAHNICNNRAKDKYSPDFITWNVARIDYRTATDLIIKNHYLHRKSNVSFAYGVFDGETIRGVITFGSPTSMRVNLSACDDYKKVIELNRLWIDDDAPFGLGTWFISRALKQLPAYIVVSYADTEILDPRYGTRHQGAIYRASSFKLAGSSRPTVEWRMPGTTRNVGKHTVGSMQVMVSSKNKYWTVTGNKSEKRNLLKICKLVDLPYS